MQPHGLPGMSLRGSGWEEALGPKNRWCSSACRGDRGLLQQPPALGLASSMWMPLAWPAGPPQQAGVPQFISLCGAQLQG